VTKNRVSKSRIINNIVESKLIKQNDKIVVAVSGGMDSMFLLYMMIEIQKELMLELVIGHINHNIRQNSIKDEKFVIAHGKKLNIPVIVSQLKYHEKNIGESTEAWARKNRYAQLELIRDEHDYDKIATGHHGNDQIETVLQRLSEKAGMGGLRGIHKQHGQIIRPCLKVSKTEIEKIVDDLQIEFIEDETNSDLEIKRNYFRHKIIPQWEALYNNLGESIQAICGSVSDNQLIIDYFIKELEDKIVTNDCESSGMIVKRINLSKFEYLPDAIKILLIKNILENDPWRRNKWNEIEKIIKSAKVGKVYNFDDYELLKDRQEWIIRYKFKVNIKPIIIRLNESVQFGDSVFLIKEVDKYSGSENPNHEIINGEEIVNSEFVLRLWQEGDSFQPLGMKGNKKISDFLIDKKVNQFKKENQVVLTVNEEIIWVCGQRISETVKINAKTKRFLELSIKTNVG